LKIGIEYRIIGKEVSKIQGYCTWNKHNKEHLAWEGVKQSSSRSTFWSCLVNGLWGNIYSLISPSFP